MGFDPDTVVEVRATGEKDWELLRDIIYEGKWQHFYEGKWQHFEVPVGAGTDFASVPTVFVWFLPRYGRYTHWRPSCMINFGGTEFRLAS